MIAVLKLFRKFLSNRLNRNRDLIRLVPPREEVADLQVQEEEAVLVVEGREVVWLEGDRDSPRL